MNAFPNILFAILLISTSKSFAQSTRVNFRNEIESPYASDDDRRVYVDVIGGTPLAGTNWVAQLYYGSNAWNLASVTNAPARFRPVTVPPALQGYWFGGTRTLNGFANLEPVTLQVRVWDGSQFASFEHALAAGGVFGASTPFWYTNANSIPPHMSDTMLHGLRAFALDSLFQNQPPTFIGGPSITINGNSGPQVFPNWATSISPGPPNERGQTTSFIVSNSTPGIFSAQPAISPTGSLAFTPATNTFGRATTTVWLRDNGGIADGGRDISEPYTFSIDILPVNRPPIAHPQNVSTDEDESLRIVLTATDPDGDSVAFSVASTRTLHGNITQDGAVLHYTPDANFSGEDQIVFSASDAEFSSSASINISVRPINDLPVPHVTVAPLFNLTPEVTNFFVLSLNGSNAPVVLDGSQSSDIETPMLQFMWLTGDPAVLFSTAPITTNLFDVGSHTVTLVVDDSETNVTSTVAFQVITASDAVNMLILMVDESSLDRRAKRPLTASLKAAAHSFENGSLRPGVDQLEAFLHKVNAQVVKADPALADELDAATAVILEALSNDNQTAEDN